MTPEFRSVVRRRLPVAILAVLLPILVFLLWKIAYGGGLHIPPLVNLIETVADDVMPEPPPPAIMAPLEKPDKWLYVKGNNVLFWPVVGDQCKQRGALMQVHKGEKALVIMRHGPWVEVELNNQALLHTHGCIHESLLVPNDGES